MRRFRLPVRYLERGLVLSAGAAWAYFRLPTVSYDLLSEEEREALLVDLAGGLAGLRDAECHLLMTQRAHPVAEWIHRLRYGAADPAEGWDAYLDRLRDHVAEEAFVGKEVYLGIRLGGRRRLLAGLVRRRRPSGTGELEGWRRQRGSLAGVLAGGGLGARTATVEELRWLVERAFWRGVGEPPRRVPQGAWSGEAVDALASATLHNHRQALCLEQAGGQAHVACLAAPRFPETLPFPGGEWLHRCDGLGFPVEASVRFRVVPAGEASSEAARQLAETTDQVRHIAGTSATPPRALLEAAGQARDLEYELARDGVPVVHAWPRFAVAAPTRAELEARVTALVHAYRDLGIDLVRPTGDQLSLFLESLPGDRVRLTSYDQHQAVTTLAGGMAVATSDLGDHTGPYIGSTTGPLRAPVHFDPLLAAQRNLPTALAITGQPGAGKTNLANLLVYQLALRGAWCLLVDPKNEASALARLPGLDRVRVLRIGADDAGLLDPFRVAGGSAEGALLAVDVLRLLLPARAASEHETALVAACQDEAETPAPSLHGIAQRLKSAPDPVVRQLSTSLRLYAELPLARLCFASGGGPALTLTDRLTILQVKGLTLPEAGVPPEEQSVADRLGVAVMFLVAHLARRLAGSAQAPAKAIVLDEAWALTGTRQGRALVERLARTGRSSNTVLGLVSQSAADLADQTVTNNLSARFAFRSTREEEVAAVLRLLGLDPAPEHSATLRGLDTGECLFADLDGRVGPVRIDLAFPELLRAFDTTPRALAEVGG